MSEDSNKPLMLPPMGHCPACGQPNGCRLETGQAYKGPCWCEALVISPATLQRLVGDLPEARCLCRRCLEAIARDPDVTREVLAGLGEATCSLAPEIDSDFYLEDGLMVFTRQYHLRRGSCCGSGCRHCPY